MPTPVFLPAPVIMHHNNYSNKPMTTDDWKMFFAFWIALHILPILFITISYLNNLIKKDNYYDIFDDNEFSWVTLLVLFAADLLGLITYFIYQIL